MKKEHCKVGKFCLYEDKRVQILADAQSDKTILVGWLENGALVTKNVSCRDLISRPGWVTQALEASRDFHYGIEDDIDAVWNDPNLTNQQMKARIDRLMVNARHEKWEVESARTSVKTISGRVFR